MVHITRLLAFAVGLAPGCCLATTWLEPFDAEVVADADAFVAGTIEEGDRLSVERVLAGRDPGEHVRIGTFHEIEIESGSKVYAWLNLDGDRWSVATPTASIDVFLGEHVLASFRISCNGALFEPAVYERIQTAWFNALHGDHDAARGTLEGFVVGEMSRAPEYFGGEGDPVNALGFFRQHAALEILASDPSLMPALDLAPFLGARDFHLQISAVRALAARTDSTAALIDVIADEATHVVPAMVAARLLRGRSLTAEQQSRLEALVDGASDEQVALCGGSIMDPRIVDGYDISPREAIRALIH